MIIFEFLLNNIGKGLINKYKERKILNIYDNNF